MWGSLEDNSRGDTLEEWLLELGANTINRGHVSTIRTCTASLTIDIFFTSSCIHHLCMGWRIHNEHILDDHVAKRFNISCQPFPSVRKRSFRKVDQLADRLAHSPSL
jgi:hypothetical protein